MPQLFINLETLPDIDGARQMYQLPADLQEKDVAKVLFHQHISTRGRDKLFLQPWQARVAVVSVVAIDGAAVELMQLDMQHSDEVHMLQQLNDLQIGSRGAFCWDQGRELNALLHVRSMIHQAEYTAAPLQAVDLCLQIAPGSYALESIAARFGLQGIAMQGDEVSWKQYRQQGIASLCKRCRTNVIATAQLGLRHLLTTGEIEKQRFDQIVMACGEL
jgi:predicted PolB exonuclease-like 3'-5' exonuclease